jgi:hypothetical protein
MVNTQTRSFKSPTLLLAASLLCCAGLGTAAHASHPADPSATPPLRGPGKACLVIRHKDVRVPLVLPPLYAGHIGWAVQIAPDQYVFGAVEGKSSDGSAGWHQIGRWNEMLAVFQHPGHSWQPYDAIKCVDVPGPKVSDAMQLAGTMPDRSKHYDLRTKNCLHATYNMIHTYGATNIPTPNWTDMIPNKYYKDFKGHETSVHH